MAGVSGGPFQGRSGKPGADRGPPLRVAPWDCIPGFAPGCGPEPLYRSFFKDTATNSATAMSTGVPFVSEAVSSPRWTRRTTALGGGVVERSLGLLDSSGVAFSLVRHWIHWRCVSPRRQGGRALGSPWTFSREPRTARGTSSDRRGRQQQLGEGPLQRGRALRLSLRCGEEDVKQTHLTRR